jgi:hypothetical protein
VVSPDSCHRIGSWSRGREKTGMWALEFTMVLGKWMGIGELLKDIP